MRATNSIPTMLVAVVAAGVGLTLALLNPPHAGAVAKATTMDIRQMPQNANRLPELKFQDATFIFTND